MEVRRITYSLVTLRGSLRFMRGSFKFMLCTILILCITRSGANAQKGARDQRLAPSYTIQDGRMYISMSRHIRKMALDSFLSRYNLDAIGLFQFLRTRSMDSLKKLGWRLEMDRQQKFIISKPLLSSDNIGNPVGDILLTERHPTSAEMFPAVNNGLLYGVNQFKHKFPFAQNGGKVTVFLRGNNRARGVMLAGSFNNWSKDGLSMTRTDSGWIAILSLGPGKYWYKFIVDGRWTVDEDNRIDENDGEGNTNSVFYVTNTLFTLRVFKNAGKVYLAGSFNDWQPDQLRMTRTAMGWELPLYLAEGTHTYRYIVDGRWISDPGNSERLPNQFGDYNSVIRLGTSYFFRLPGYADARQVILTGSFNRWRRDELYMEKTPTGWVLPYTLGPGNYEYQFGVNGEKWITDPQNPLVTHQDGRIKNSYLIIGANYTFHLRGYVEAKSIYLAGDFDDFSPGTLAMKREGDGWTLTVHLFAGKHLYKYIVDGQWIKDPGNDLWEQNEFGSGNSIIWVEK